jgi:hypothetical protein
MVPGENHNVPGAFSFNKIEILANGISRTFVPIASHALLGGHYPQVMTQIQREDVPSLFQMVYKRLGFILGKHQDLIGLGIDAVAQRNVEQSINASKGSCGFGTILSEGH